jgi:hypothetical protein
LKSVKHLYLGAEVMLDDTQRVSMYL